MNEYSIIYLWRYVYEQHEISEDILRVLIVAKSAII